MNRLGVVLAAVLTAAFSAAASAAELAVVSKVPAQQPFGDRLQVHSQALGRDMIVTVTPPLAGLPKDGKVAVIYALDEGYGVAGPAGSAMAGGGAMAPALIVAVGWVPGQWNARDEDLLYGQASYDRRTLHGRGPAFEAFLLDELKPYIEANYPADPGRAFLFGHSSAAVFATEMLARKPGSFSGYVIASPALWLDPAVLPAAAKAARSAGAARVFLAVGGAETPVMVSDEQALAKALSAPGSQLTVRSHVYDGARHAAYFTPLFAEAFPWLLPPQQEAAAPPKTLIGYAGTYAFPDGRRLVVAARGSQLFADMAGFAERELLLVEAAKFRLPDYPVTYRFSAEDGGQVVVDGDGPQARGRRVR
jgi:predicted alpha/beta superfamily hydrolase